MLRILASVFSFIGGVCALVAPIAIIHWLIKAVGDPATMVVIEPLNPFFDPLNETLDALYEMPVLRFQEQRVPTTQGILGCLLTCMFFVCHYIAVALKKAEKRLNVTVESQQRHVADFERKLQKERAVKRTIASKNLIAMVRFDFDQNETVAQILNTLQPYQANQIKAGDDFVLVAFQDLSQALSYCLETQEKITSYYRSLRPMDYKPPFRIGLHAIETGEENVMLGQEKCHHLVRFGGENQVVFSKACEQYIDAHGLAGGYRFHSLGDYDFPLEKNDEVFLLVAKK